MIILITNWQAAHRARDLAESMSDDPQLRHAARVRAMRRVARQAERAHAPQPAQVICLDTRQAWQRAARLAAVRRRLEDY